MSGRRNEQKGELYLFTCSVVLLLTTSGKWVVFLEINAVNCNEILGLNVNCIYPTIFPIWVLPYTQRNADFKYPLVVSWYITQPHFRFLSSWPCNNTNMDKICKMQTAQHINCFHNSYLQVILFISELKRTNSKIKISNSDISISFSERTVFCRIGSFFWE